MFSDGNIANEEKVEQHAMHFWLAIVALPTIDAQFKCIRQLPDDRRSL